MSSVSRGVSTPARPPASKTEAVRQDLHTHLRKTARFIKILDILVIFFAWAAAALMVWLLACLVDHWLFPLPTALRWAIWMAGLSATLWWSIAYLIPLLTRRINPVYAARRIENLVPEFKNGLVSWLELESMPEHGVPRGVMAALTYRAARFIGGQDPSATVDTSQLIKLIGGVLLLTTALAVYTMISPKSSLVTAHRILAPWASVSSPTRVHILQVKPGSVELTQGKPLEVEVNLRGLFADEPVFARFSTLDGQLSDQRVPLDVVSQGMRYAGLVTTTSAGVESELDYWIEAGDARRGPYRVTLSPLPTVALESISLEFPSYTKLEPRVVAASGEVEAVEGTWATIVAGANQSMSRGRLEVNPEIDGDGELIRAQAFVTLNVDDRKLSGKLLLKLNEQGDNPSTINYRIRGYNARRNANPRPILHRLSAFADVAPEVSLLGPDSRVARVAPDSRVNLECRAHDPDFGLTELRLVVHKNGLPLFEKLLIQSDGTVGRQVRSFELNLAEHQARVGDRFQIIATATDNRHDPVSGKAAPNSAQSEALLLEVAEPEQVDDSQPLLNPTQQPGGPPDVNAQQLADSLSSPQPPNSQPSAPNAGQEGGASPPAEQADAAASGEQRSNAAQQESPQAGAQQNKSNQTDQKSSSQPGNPAPDASPAQQSADQASGEQQPAGSSSAGAGSSGDKTQSGDSQQQGTPGGSSSSQNANPGSEQSPGSAASGSQSSSASPNSNSSPAAGSGTSSASPSSQTSAGGQSNTNASPSSSSSISQGSGGAAGQNGTATGDRPNQTNSGQTNSSQANSGQARSQSEQDGDAILRVQDFMKTQQDQAAADGASTARQKSDGSAAPKPTPAAPPSNTQPSTDQQAGGQQADSQQSGGQQSDGQQSGSQQSGAQQSGAQQSDSQQSGAQQSGAQQSDSQQSGGQQSGSQQSGAQQSGAQQSDSQQSGGQQSGSQQSGSQQSGGQQSGAQQAGSQQSGAQQSGAQQSGSQQSGAQQSGAQQSGGQQSDSQQSGGQQSGSQQSGAQQSGSQQSGGQQSGAQQSGSQQSGGQQSGAQQAGSQQSGGQQSGAQQSDSQQSGGQQSGSQQSGAQQSGSQQSGSQQSGSQQSGSQQSGSQQSGSQQSGSQQSGSQQSGSQQSGSQQSGSQQSGAQQSGAQQSGSQGAAASADSGQTGSSQADSSSSPPKGSAASQSPAAGGQAQGGSAADGSASGSAAPSKSPQQGGENSSGGAPQGGDGGKTVAGDAVNQNDAEQTTQLVLDYLNRQRDQPDPELLRELNWTKADFQSFLDRWNQARDLSTSEDPKERLQWQQKLQELGLSTRSRKAIAGSGNNDAFRQQQDGGTRIRPPESLRKQYEAFRQALQQPQD